MLVYGLKTRVLEDKIYRGSLEDTIYWVTDTFLAWDEMLLELAFNNDSLFCIMLLRMDVPEVIALEEGYPPCNLNTKTSLECESNEAHERVNMSTSWTLCCK